MATGGHTCVCVLYRRVDEGNKAVGGWHEVHHLTMGDAKEAILALWHVKATLREWCSVAVRHMLDL